MGHKSDNSEKPWLRKRAHGNLMIGIIQDGPPCSKNWSLSSPFHYKRKEQRGARYASPQNRKPIKGRESEGIWAPVNQRSQRSALRLHLACKMGGVEAGNQALEEIEEETLLSSMTLSAPPPPRHHL
ncbi:hypothetical protein HAX54_011261 [Datura stramonium]|uniref:Uncharacterized protein n=1 Tax=Datura stramonium TaxID=4076 RepID=A0ABS8Y0E5_DATST|nr:hypothetical protein [Datura stramonium]